MVKKKITPYRLKLNYKDLVKEFKDKIDTKVKLFCVFFGILSLVSIFSLIFVTNRIYYDFLLIALTVSPIFPFVINLLRPIVRIKCSNSLIGLTKNSLDLNTKAACFKYIKKSSKPINFWCIILSCSELFGLFYLMSLWSILLPSIRPELCFLIFITIPSTLFAIPFVMVDTGDFYEFLVRYGDKQSIEHNEEVMEAVCNFLGTNN